MSGMLLQFEFQDLETSIRTNFFKFIFLIKTAAYNTLFAKLYYVVGYNSCFEKQVRRFVIYFTSRSGWP